MESSFQIEIALFKENKFKCLTVSYLREIREARNISQRTMAEILGISEQRYGSIERHRSIPTLAVISRIISILGVTFSDAYKVYKIPIELYESLKYLNINSINEIKYDENINYLENKLKSSDYTSSDYEELMKLRKQKNTVLKNGDIVDSKHWKMILDSLENTKTKDQIIESCNIYN